MQDSLTLQSILLEKKAELKNEGDQRPDVQRAVQDMLMQLFIEVYNHQVRQLTPLLPHEAFVQVPLTTAALPGRVPSVCIGAVNGCGL